MTDDHYDHGHDDHELPPAFDHDDVHLYDVDDGGLEWDDGGDAHGVPETPEPQPQTAWNLEHPADEADQAEEAVEARAETVDEVEVFPPALQVELPEPVDGFPWIDTGSLGVVTAAMLAENPPPDPVTAEQIADYAAADLPPGADPWATLAASDDPATAALARWWSQNT